jgi:ligand-binding sensor domain-containing protein
VKPALFFLLIYLSSTAGAQMPFTRLTSEDGLGNNSVQCILQGRDGIMWIGTNGGLNRYDGAAFIQYNILSKPALSSNVITALLEDDAGNIWEGTDNGLNILDPVANTIRLFSHSDLSSSALSPGPVKALQKMKEGSIWILSATRITAYTLQNGFRRVALDSCLLGPTKVLQV